MGLASTIRAVGISLSCTVLPLPPPHPSLSSISLKWQQTNVSLCKDQMKSMALGLLTKEQGRLHRHGHQQSPPLHQPAQITLAAITVIFHGQSKCSDRFWQTLMLQPLCRFSVLVFLYSRIAHSELFFGGRLLRWVWGNAGNHPTSRSGVHRIGVSTLVPHMPCNLNSASQGEGRREKNMITPWHKYAVCALVSCNFFTSMCRNIYPQ